MRKIFILFLFLTAAVSTHAANWSHSLSLYDAARYDAGFSHFDYVNPDAPTGGKVVLEAPGTFDSLNPFILKGNPAAGVANLTFDTLMVTSSDEASVAYGLVAEGVRIADDRTAVTFKLREEARFHDGSPLTADDVVFSFNVLKAKGNPFYRTYYADVASVEKLGSHEVKFLFTTTENRELPLILGQMPVLSKAYYAANDFAKTSLEAPLASGPYRVASVDAGKAIVFERVEDYWAKDLPVNVGKHNFDAIQYDYYRDRAVAFEAFKAGEIDVFQENVAKRWATQYGFPAIENGRVIKDTIPHELPTGMQGFVYNTRRAVFADPQVREALSYAFDFGWTNVNLFNGAYTRTRSYFSNSELASKGLPSPGELRLLEAYKPRIAPDVFEEVYEPPKTDGSGQNRENLKTALTLLKQAGYGLTEDGVMINKKTKQPLTFEVLLVSPAFERVVMPFKKSLERLGIAVSVRTVDAAQYQKRLQDFDFDMIVHVWGQSLSPGNEQRNYWSSAAASTPGSQNYAGITDPVVDALVENVIRAPNRTSLINATRALDRVLLNGHYVIPHWHLQTWRLAYWNKFGKPVVLPRYALGFPDIWWLDADKAAALETGAGVSPSDSGSFPLWLAGLIGLGILAAVGVFLAKRKRPKNVNDL